MQTLFTLDEVLLNAPIGIAVMNYDGNYVATNPAYNNIYGYVEGELIGQSVAIVFPKEMQEKVITLHKSFLDKGGKLGGEWEVVRRDGKHAYVISHSICLEQPSGEKLRFVYVTDITERRQAEIIQQKLNAELSNINEELQRFTYIASHDLKSPLRGIDQLASWITEDLGDAIPESSQEHLRLMRNRINRMERLLEDLLEYSRIGRISDASIEIYTRQLVQDIAELSYSDKKIHWRLSEDLPKIKAQKIPLEMVFRNLINNAIKHHDKTEINITVTASVNSKFIEFAVSDDGPGIAPEHHQRIFNMFQTLKPRDVVEGSGIGLAVVKKTVETMGGSVRVESTGTHGSCFYFTWPIE